MPKISRRVLHDWEKIPDFDGMTDEKSLAWKCRKCSVETRMFRKPPLAARVSVSGSRISGKDPWTLYLEVQGAHDKGMTCDQVIAWQVMES